MRGITRPAEVFQGNKGFDPAAIERIEIEAFDVAYHIIGGGEEGDKTIVRTKEEADPGR